MSLPIDQDASRYQQIVRGKVRENLKSYISNSQMIGRQGKNLVSIPIQQIELPRFRFDDSQGGLGEGDGEVGDPIGQGQPRNGKGKAGNQPGQHILEVELTLEELAQILGEELELPRIEPRGKDQLDSEVIRYNGIRRVGPEGLRHFKRTYREALKRQMASGTYNPAQPVVVPIRDDKRYRSWTESYKPCSNAVILYMMDVSGSMTDNKKRLVRMVTFWIDTWLKANYRNLVTRYIVHDYEAGEVDENTFYHIQESGGTRISSAYALAKQIIEKDYNPADWNVYAFHFSDGENSGNEDDQRCLKLLQETLLPASNLFCFGQIQSEEDYLFRGFLENHLDDDKLVTAQITDDQDIYSAIKVFLGKGY